MRDSVISECPDPDTELRSSMDGHEKLSPQAFNKPNMVFRSRVDATPGSKIDDCNSKATEVMSNNGRITIGTIEIPS